MKTRFFRVNYLLEYVSASSIKELINGMAKLANSGIIKIQEDSKGKEFFEGNGVIFLYSKKDLEK